jgi:tetratricopeptide (TPR) repeat protein
VAPLRYGAGIKGKICQAFGHGLANVTTSIGAENMALTPNVELLVADTPQALAEAMLRAYSDERLWQQLVERGRIYLTRHHAPSLVQESVLGAMLPPPAAAASPEFLRIRAYEALADGMARLGTRDIDGARAAFAKAGSLCGDTDVWLAIADAWRQVRHDDLYRETLRHAIALSPDDPVAYTALADAFETDGDYDAAFEVLDTLCQRVSSLPVDVRARHARLLTTLGRVEAAEAAWKALVADVPEETGFRYWIGRTRHAQGDHAGAIAEYGAALRAALDDDLFAEACAIDRWLTAARNAEPRPSVRSSADVMRFRALAPRLQALGDSRRWDPPPCTAELSAGVV